MTEPDRAGPPGPPERPTGDPHAGGSSDQQGRRDPRLRSVAMVLGTGIGLAVGASGAAGLAGAPGSAAAVVLLLLCSLALAAAALVALGTAVVDEVRGRPVGRARIVVGVVLFLAAAATMAMTAGAGG